MVVQLDAYYHQVWPNRERRSSLSRGPRLSTRDADRCDLQAAYEPEELVISYSREEKVSCIHLECPDDRAVVLHCRSAG